MRYIPHIDFGYIPGETPLVVRHAEKHECFKTHTPCPEDYIQWHEWAGIMSRTHRQLRCPHCGKFAVREKREPGQKRGPRKRKAKA